MTTRTERLNAMKRDYFFEDRHEDPHTRQRTVPMQVLNLSFPRTGSMSMQAALNHLGYRCYHSNIFFSAIRDTDMWIEALEAKFAGQGRPFGKEQWDALLGNFSAVSADPPAICFAEELLEAYPEAKVILIDRNLDSWFESYDQNVIKAISAPGSKFIANLDSSYVGKIRAVHATWMRLWMGANSADEHRAVAKGKYRAHYEVIRKIVPKERLLEFKLEQGWGPLCDFLGKPRPAVDVPFPRVNDADANWDLIYYVLQIALFNILKKTALYIGPVALAGVVWYMW